MQTAHAVGDTVELYQINSVPLTEINKTHTAIADIGIGLIYSFSINNTICNWYIWRCAEVGGTAVFASENYRFELNAKCDYLL